MKDCDTCKHNVQQTDDGITVDHCSYLIREDGEPYLIDCIEYEADYYMEKKKIKRMGNKEYKVDDRERVGFWESGHHCTKCCNCSELFMGSKDSSFCADCAYKICDFPNR